MSRYLYIIIAVLLAGCTKSAELGSAPVEITYLEDLEEFYATRHHSLTEEFGWMRLAGAAKGKVCEEWCAPPFLQLSKRVFHAGK